MESRIAILEQIARTATMGLEWLDRRMEGFDHRMESFDHRLDSLDHRMGSSDRRMDGLDHRMQGIERRADEIILTQRSDFRWMVSLMLACIASVIGMFSALLGVIAHGFHWL